MNHLSICSSIYSFACWYDRTFVQYLQYVWGLWQPRLGTADIFPVKGSSCYHGSLDTWTFVPVTAVIFKLITISVSGFAFSNVENIFIFMILNHHKHTEFGKHPNPEDSVPAASYDQQNHGGGRLHCHHTGQSLLLQPVCNISIGIEN